MPPIVLALFTLTIAVPKRKVCVVSRIYLLPHSFRKQKICFNQCRFLFRKLRTWKNKLTSGTKSQFPKEEVLLKILKPNFPKRRRRSFRCRYISRSMSPSRYSDTSLSSFSFVSESLVLRFWETLPLSEIDSFSHRSICFSIFSISERVSDTDCSRFFACEMSAEEDRYG